MRESRQSGQLGIQKGFHASASARTAFDYKPQQSRSTSHARWFISGLLVPLIGGVIAYAMATREGTGQAAISLDDLPPIEIQDVAIPAVMPPSLLGDTVEFVVRRNDTLDRIFRQLKLNLTDLASIRDVPGVQANLDQLRVGDTITLVHEEGLVQQLTRRISETEILSVTRVDEGFKSEVIETPVAVQEVHAEGTVDSSLFAAARAAGVSPELILQMANDIFGWEIDFALDIQPGDKFNLVYEQKYRDGKFIGNGRILAADFMNAGTLHRSVYFASKDGQVADYFAPDGRSMRRAFLRAPLEFTRISSNFNPKRRHPILNTIRAHKGVDYAASTGTVIKAAGDGRVSFVGMKGGYGRVVILEHGGGVSTLYGHMSRFAGIRAGQRVRQGNTIGFVGSSGAATGPHLHYEYLVNGVHKNPRTVLLPTAAPISDGYRAEFASSSGQLLSKLDRAEAATVASLP
ncbi:peptidoglycan DD-metalloendopeptidase family protein [Steroidobacter sp.]|uniref:peptidoglycan DD-metalloendopeptidase family protein n=1 Tax=Steroidobacter sp. TaxID=1978227 RepID=UPI001A4AED7F|nr:peptidoglycan DD-metalloendopeptidase family protein [Steroidobacter sp.]MBL8265745.1 peptidoglycan DD-metalloendopeptidase family protein [Steroidobacter sp.]